MERVLILRFAKGNLVLVSNKGLAVTDLWTRTYTNLGEGESSNFSSYF